jgi:DNA-binding IclR family transcriptional regulator
VLAMRQLRAEGVQVKVIAERFGIHRAHASRILRGLRWPEQSFVHEHPAKSRREGWIVGSGMKR